MTLRFALFGAGRIGAIHAGNLARHSRAELRYVVDVNGTAAQELARSHGAVAADADTALKDPSIGAVLIASSTNTHADLCVASAKAGKAIFCEKPIDLSLTRVEQCLAAVITQNIDGQHQRAGSREVYELHGHVRSATCFDCAHQVPARSLIEPVLNGKIPRCACGGLFKPDVVLFDELLPRGLFWLAQRAIERCDVVLVAGTALEVAPVCEMPLAGLRRGARLIIVNQSETYLDDRADVVLHEDVSEALPAIAGCKLA